VPVGVGLTVAVNVAVCPEATGFGETVKVVVVAVSGFTVSVVALEVEAANPAFPEYVAVRLSDPVARPVLVNVTIPEETMLAVPSSVVPL
jgi:hypothetical protein